MIHSHAAHLMQQAALALQHAHAPYSGFRVGAALLSDSGQVFLGCNVENASYGLSMCAERAAVLAAVAAGQRSFTALAITSDAPPRPYPCGACRQVLAEFCPPDFPILVCDSGAAAPEWLTLGGLLPKAFKLPESSKS